MSDIYASSSQNSAPHLRTDLDPPSTVMPDHKTSSSAKQHGYVLEDLPARPPSSQHHSTTRSHSRAGTPPPSSHHMIAAAPGNADIEALRSHLHDELKTAGHTGSSSADLDKPLTELFDSLDKELVDHSKDDDSDATRSLREFIDHGELRHVSAPPAGPSHKSDVIRTARHPGDASVHTDVDVDALVRDAHSLLSATPTREERAFAICLAFVNKYGAQIFANKDFTSQAAKTFESILNVAVRNSLAVVVPTTLRQLLSYGIENALTDAGANNNTRTAIATLTTLLPVMLLMMGLARDKMHGTETAASQRSRLIMAGGALLATVLGIAFGQMAPSASQILAFTCYTFMRDIVVQSRLRLNNLNAGDNPPSKLHFALISLVYGIDQFLVNLGMSKLASPSGPSAFIAGAGIQGSHALIRGGLNGAGESVEDVAFGGIGAALDRKTLQLRTTDAGYQRHNVINGALGPFPVRSAFLDMSIIGSNIISQYVRDPTKQEYLNNLYFFALTAILYEPFANASSGQPQPPATQDPDTGSQHGSDVVYTSHNQNWTRPNSTRSMALSDLREGERPGSRGASIEDAPIDDAPPVDSASVGAANSGNVHDTEAGSEFVDPQYLPSQDPPALPPSPRPSISRNSIKTSSSTSAEDSGTPPA